MPSSDKPTKDTGAQSPGISFSADHRRGDGSMEISVAPDNMSVTADILPPLGNGEPVSPGYAANLLAKLGINYGVDWDRLNEAILEANVSRKARLGYVLARGTPPVPDRGERVVLGSRFTAGFAPIEAEKNSVDWKEISSFILVKKDEVLAVVEPPLTGTLGSDVFGNPIPYARENPQSYALGKNVERRDDAIVAAVDGRLIMDGSRLLVEETLVIPGNVDYRVGHVMFPGDVMIQGGVAAGFKVYSGGSIVIQQTMDAFDVSAKKDLTCLMGLIGKDQGFVRVGGNLKAKFVENARVAVRGDADIPGSVVGSRLYVLGKLSMGDKGRIVGGETWATHGIRCGWLGGTTRPATSVNVGIDFTMQQKLDKANAALRELAVRIGRLDQVLKARPDPAIARQRAELASKAAALSASIEELARLVDADEAAVVEARLGVHPGVRISICHITISVDAPMKKARFRLDRAANKIIIEN